MHDYLFYYYEKYLKRCLVEFILIIYDINWFAEMVEHATWWVSPGLLRNNNICEWWYIVIWTLVDALLSGIVKKSVYDCTLVMLCSQG